MSPPFIRIVYPRFLPFIHGESHLSLYRPYTDLKLQVVVDTSPEEGQSATSS
jgi:hypothetical protein